MRRDYARRDSSGGRRILIMIILTAVIATFIYGIFLLFSSERNFFGSESSIAINLGGNKKKISEQKWVFGKNVKPEIIIENENSVCSAEIRVTQSDKKMELPQAHFNFKLAKKSFSLPLDLSNLAQNNFAEGEAILEIVTTDCAFFSKTTTTTTPFSFDLTPPVVALTSTQHYINQGGADLATYTVSPDAVSSGVRIGPYSFKGFNPPGSPENSGERFTIFVYSYDLPVNTPIEVFAVDAAGNESIATLKPARFYPKEFRTRRIDIDEDFIKNKIHAIIAQTPELKLLDDPVKNFLQVNSDLRKKNALYLKTLSEKSAQKFLWKNSFTPLTNASIEASFADHRLYYYQDQKIDEQDHLGFDLAVVERNPIAAAQDGIVMLAEFFGIYGNTVVIDHGFGIITLYAHLSKINVAVGDQVTRGQVIGNSGETGLAGGDHLHFSLLIQGVQTNPIEFWDQHWIDDHIYLRVKP